MNFKNYLKETWNENLWGDIPWPYKKPSEPQGGLDANPSRTDNGGGGTSNVPPQMMKKRMRKKMKKS